jgi:hypothetical protein
VQRFAQAAIDKGMSSQQADESYLVQISITQ